MRTSQEGVNLIKYFEGLHDGDLKKIGLQPKKCPAGIWTEGYGHAMRGAGGSFLKTAKMPNSTITLAQADELLKKDLSVFETIVERKINVPLKQNQFDALVSHTYNTGGSGTLFKLINENAPIEQIRNWWLNKYVTGGGILLRGLVERRKMEFNLFAR